MQRPLNAFIKTDYLNALHFEIKYVYIYACVLTQLQ